MHNSAPINISEFNDARDVALHEFMISAKTSIGEEIAYQHGFSSGWRAALKAMQAEPREVQGDDRS